MRRASRRDFLKTTAFAGAGFWLSTSRADVPSTSPNEKIRFACFGLGAMGKGDTGGAGKLGDVVALCDVDEKMLDEMAKNYPKAKKYTDYRKLLEEMRTSIDGVTVSTPDHMHAPIAAMAMKLGKGVYCQKPLAHSVYEARRLAEIARETKVATQMGNQGTSSPALRKMAAMIAGGCVGPVKEVHVWTNRAGKWWTQGKTRPPAAKTPPGLHWAEWLGPAPKRPYAEGYHPFAWRGVWDFGTGALGDMGCHAINMPFMALNLRNPSSVEAETSPNNKEQYPDWAIVNYEFPALGSRPALTMKWYDGGKLPPQELIAGIQDLPQVQEEAKQPEKEGKKKIDRTKLASSGILIVGEKGKLYAPGDYASGAYFLLGGATEVATEAIELPMGYVDWHYHEWAQAIRGGSAPRSNFPDYSGPLTETVLLGNLAVWVGGKKIQWDSATLKSPNCPEVEAIVRKTYENGYTPL